MARNQAQSLQALFRRGGRRRQRAGLGRDAMRRRREDGFPGGRAEGRATPPPFLRNSRGVPAGQRAGAGWLNASAKTGELKGAGR